MHSRTTLCVVMVSLLCIPLLPIVIPNMSSIDGVGSNIAFHPQQTSLPSYTSHDPIVINNNTDFATQSWPGDGSFGNPYMISGLNITTDDICISIHDTDVFFFIHDCLLSTGASGRGLEFVNVSNGEVELTDFVGGTYSAYLQETHNVTIEAATFRESTVGISMSQSTHARIGGSRFYGQSYGIELSYTTNTSISGNFITRCETYGIFLHVTGNNSIGYNIFTGNYIGLFLNTNAHMNQIYGNYFANNNHSNAYDEAIDNSWNKTELGNTWSDFDGTGVYLVPGDGDAIDYFPSVAENELSIIPPENIEYVLGTTGQNINWSVESEKPMNYIVYMNGTRLISSDWNGSDIVVNVDNLGLGSYNYTIVVHDITFFNITDTVYVFVVEEAPPPPNWNYSLILGLVGIALVAVFLFIVYRRKEPLFTIAKLDERVKIVAAVILGIMMFSLEMFFSFFSVITFYLAGFVLILFLIGLVSGSFKNGLISASLTLLLMMPIGALLFPLTGFTFPNNDIVSWLITLMLILMCRPLGDINSEDNAGLGCLIVLLFPIIVIFLPLYFSFGIGMACVGGILGKLLWEHIEVNSAEVEPAIESNNQD